MRLTGSTVGGALIALVCFTALAFGSVYPWAFKTMEVVSFLLLIVWMGSVLVGTAEGENGWPAISRYALPIFLFLGLCGAQLIRVHPGTLTLISPAAASLYQRVLHGWPGRAPYAQIPIVETPPSDDPNKVYILPTPREVEQGAAIPFAPSAESTQHAVTNGAAREEELLAEQRRLPWYGVSISPSLGRTAVIKACCYAALFLLVVACPWGDAERERRVIRVVMLSFFAIGVVVAALGLINRALWNGRILWVLRPEDWGSGGPVLLRASGPFINPDDFANYLAMLLPLALAAALYNVPLRYTRRITGFKLIGAAGAVTIASAILLSFSRAGWAATGVGVATFLMLTAIAHEPRHHEGHRDLQGRSLPSATRGWSWMPFVAGLSILIVLVPLAVITIAPTIATRSAHSFAAVTEANANLSLVGRLGIWRDTVAMIRDFPWLGVGLGGWPAVFPHYRSRPWFPLAYREAHNDYLQLLAETGIVGAALVAWVLFVAIRSLIRGRRNVAPEDWPLLAALVAAVPVMALHESFDFCFRIPANAVLFTLLLGFAVRMASGPSPSSDRRYGRLTRLGLPVAVMAGSIFLIVAAVADPAASYPYDLKTPQDGTEALANVLEHPGRSEAHMDLPHFMADSAGIEPRLREFSSAVWLDPINPGPRDRYAAELFAARQPAEALKQITTSVYNAPAGNEHFYLNERYVPFLSDQVVAAIEQAYRRLLADNEPAGFNGLSAFYAAQGRYDEQAQLLADYVNTHPKPDYLLLMATGEAYVRAGNRARAESFFKQAVSNNPSQMGPYLALISDVYGPEGDLAAARAIVEQGVKRGLDSTTLYWALLNLARAAKDKDLTETCLRQLMTNHPSTATLIQLGSFYLDSNQPDRAVPVFRRAISMNPGSSDAYFLLGRAEEADYRYSAADDAYSRAISLAPGNADYRQAYQAFRDKIKKDAVAQ